MADQKIAPVLRIDDLAQEIRRVDGSHNLGAGGLAEALMPFIEQAVLARVGAVPLADCWSDNDGDTWRDSPEDSQFVDALKVGDEYELQASIRSWPERFRVTKAPDDVSDDYEVQPVDIVIKGTPAAASLSECLTCGDRSEIGGFVGMHSGYQTDPCPDCTPAAALAGAQPIELKGVAETVADGGGFWRSCSGCHELNEGVATGPMSAVLGCNLDNGCSECGGIGAVWDTTDYQAMADSMVASMTIEPQSSVNPGPLAAVEPSDTARLDYLDAVPQGCIRLDKMEFAPFYIYWGTLHKLGGTNEMMNFVGPTARTAIDAAIAASKEGESHADQG